MIGVVPEIASSRERGEKTQGSNRYMLNHGRQDVLYGESRSLELSRDQVQKLYVPIEKAGAAYLSVT